MEDTRFNVKNPSKIEEKKLRVSASKISSISG